MSYFDCVVIGAGVAGMTSAIYLKRYNLNVLLLEKSSPGGQIIQTPNVENYPGFSNIDGATLALQMFEQVTNLGIQYQYGNVIKIKNLENEKIVYTETEEIHTKTIIIATGRKAKKLGLEKENELVGKGISWCATCDGMFSKNKHIAVVGGGNSALEEAIFLSSICKKVEVFYRGEKLRADKIVQEKVSKIENIVIHYKTEVIELYENENQLVGVTVIENGKSKKYNIGGLFIYIGFEPDTLILQDLGIKVENNYVVVDKKMQTNIAGIFASGDVIKKDLYQLTTATGEASIAAYQVKNYLALEKNA